MSLNFKQSVLAVIISAVVSGCGGSGSGDNGTIDNPTAIDETVIDGDEFINCSSISNSESIQHSTTGIDNNIYPGSTVALNNLNCLSDQLVTVVLVDNLNNRIVIDSVINSDGQAFFEIPMIVLESERIFSISVRKMTSSDTGMATSEIFDFEKLMTVSPLPSSGLAIGAITLEAYTQQGLMYESAITHWKSIATVLGEGNADIENTITFLENSVATNKAIQEEITALVNGDIDEVFLGIINGVEATLTLEGDIKWSVQHDFQS